MRSTDLSNCPRTRARVCECSGVNKITEAEETVKAVVQLEHVEGDITGSVVMKQDPGKPTIIRGLIKGLKPGMHGIHIHEFGDLSKGCDSAGGHYNPDGVDHGDLAEGHVGDLGNIEANEDGIARFKIVARRVDLSGDRSVVGRALVIHADEDDLGKGGDEESLKTGNAGERLACGVIRLRQGIEEDYQRVVGKKHFDRNQLPQIKRHHIQNSDLKYKEGMISIDKIIPVQTQRVKGLAKKSQDVFLNNEDRPFIVDRKGYLINGHHRFDAANVLGIKRVPAIMIDADIEDVMDKFKDETSDTKVMKENYFKDLLKSKMSEAEVVNFPGTHVKREYVNINGVKMLKDVWDYMSQDREEEHGLDDNMNRVHKKLSNFTGKEDPRILKKAYQVELRNFIDEFENQDMDPQPFIDELKQLDERNLNPDVADYIKGKKTKLIKVKVADLDDEANDDRFGRVIDVDPDVGVDLDNPILLDIDGKTILDGFHRVYQAKRVGREYIPAEIIDENFADGKVKGKSRPGRVKKAGASCKGSVSSLRAKAKKYSGEKGKMYHWCANMKGGKKKK